MGLSGFDCRFVCYITLPSVPSVAGLFDDVSQVTYCRHHTFPLFQRDFLKIPQFLQKNLKIPFFPPLLW